MTNFSAWDSKATSLVREAEANDKEEARESDKALGLDGVARGPSTVKAESELKELTSHSEQRKEFIDWSKQREVTQTHTPREEVVMLEGPEVKDKALRLSGSEGVHYVVPEGSGIVKLMLDNCKRVKIQILSSIITSTIDVSRCSDVSFELSVPIGTFQVDECASPVAVNFAEPDHVGRLYHQNSPGLAVGFGGSGAELHSVGKSGDVQYFTKLGDAGAEKPFVTNFVRRGENEFPIELSEGSEVNQVSDETAQKAEAKRQAGNAMFRANDFMQAAMEYTRALELDPTIGALYANRSQCWLKLGNHENALDDAVKCIEVDPANSKGWFRKGMSLHAMKRYPEAIPTLLEAEKIEPNNKQITDAIKMAQLMARMGGGA